MTHEEDIQRYIDGVCEGTIVTGRLERLAVWRYLDDLENAPSRGFYFDPKIANHAINFSKLCRQFESPFVGQPLNLRVDQKFVVWNVMGWRQSSDGLRRFRQVQYEKARKNGKSTTAAYLACLLLYADNPIEYGAQGYVAATKQEQATIVWKAGMKMIQRSPALAKMTKITESDLKIEIPRYDSIFKPLASDKTPDGFNPHFIIKDEEHAYREKHREQGDTLGSGFGTRAQPLTITITTYGDDQSVIWKESHDYAVQCLESVITGEIINDRWFAFICALDYLHSKEQQQPCFRCKGAECPWCDGSGFIPSDDPYDEKVWRKANPGIGPGVGFTPQLEKMQETALEAKHRPEKRPEFFQKNLNIIVASGARLISPEAWNACKGELSNWNTADRVHSGMDLGRSNDMGAGACVARYDMIDDDNKPFIRLEIRARAWTCKDRHKDVQSPQIQRWIDDELLEECSGDQILFSDIEDWLISQSRLWNSATVAYDIHFASRSAQRLQEDFQLIVYPFPQNHGKYSEPFRAMMEMMKEVRIVDGKPVRALVHDGDPVMAWMMTNMVCNKNNKDQWMPDKGASTQKIDIAVAVVMAISECLFSEEGGRSIYCRQKRGFIEIG